MARARVIADVQEAALLGERRGVVQRPGGSAGCPPRGPGRKTASHSRPLARWIVEEVDAHRPTFARSCRVAPGELAEELGAPAGSVELADRPVATRSRAIARRTSRPAAALALLGAASALVPGS